MAREELTGREEHQRDSQYTPERAYCPRHPGQVIGGQASNGCWFDGVCGACEEEQAGPSREDAAHPAVTGATPATFAKLSCLGGAWGLQLLAPGVSPGVTVYVARRRGPRCLRQVGRVVGTNGPKGVVYATILGGQGSSDRLPGVAALAARCAARAQDKDAADARWEAEEPARQQGATDEQFRHDMGYLADKAGV